MSLTSGILKCRKCKAEKQVASLSNSTYYSTWIKWQKIDDKYILGCYGDGGEANVWWWDVTHYVHEKDGDEVCWNRYGGSTEKEWIKIHYKWKCLNCCSYFTSFTDFIENNEENEENEEE